MKKKTRPYTLETCTDNGAWHTVVLDANGHCVFSGSESPCRAMCEAMNAAYASGRASRDAEVKALRKEVGHQHSELCGWCSFEYSHSDCAECGAYLSEADLKGGVR